VESLFQSKLPNFGVNIFIEMSMMAIQYKAINLSQVFPEFDMPEFLKVEINHAIADGKNQYCPSSGLPELLNQIGQMMKNRYQKDLLREQKVDGMNIITVSSGATETLWVAIQTLVRDGGGVIVFDPAYDSYEPTVELAGGSCCHFAMNAPNYAID
jgi:methionine aminotransferase